MPLSKQEFTAQWLRGVLGLSPAATVSFAENPVEGLIIAPYSAEATTESIVRFPDGNRITQTTISRFYRDSKARTRTERSSPGTADIDLVLIADSLIGQHYILSPQSKVANVLRASDLPAKPQQPPVPLPENGFQSILTAFSIPATSLGEKDIDGVKTVGTRWERTFPAGTVGNDKPITLIIEQWYSPDLGIIIAASQHTSTGSDITYRLHNISRNEPDPALFAIPADYARHEAQATTMSATRKK